MIRHVSEFKTLYDSIPRGYTLSRQGEIQLYHLPSLSRQEGLRHGFTGRRGGVSKAPYASLNLSFTNDDRDSVLENHRRMAAAADFPDETMVMDSYEHGTTVLTVTKEDAGKGYTLPSLPPCDGLVTKDVGLTLITGHADCMAFYFYDPKARVIGLCHAGWRGALGRIGSVVVEKMKALGAAPEDIIAGVGPSICPKCFEVGRDVAEMFQQAFPLCPLRSINKKLKPTVDLWQVALCQFLESGLLPEHISFMGLCTMESEDMYSYRREGRTGGMAAYLRME